MANKIDKSRTNRQRQKKIIKREHEEEKIIEYVKYSDMVDVEVGDLFRIRPQDFSAFKKSYEEFASKWEFSKNE